jgi:predicted nucleic acid-binding protein
VPRYVLDTNLYIRATRSDEWNGALEAFYAKSAPFVYLHSVVAAELLAGCASPDLERRTQAGLVAPFERRGRVISPGHGAWKRAGLIVAALVREKRLSPNGIQRSFLNDCLLAASAREHGFTLVTDNPRDFDLIRTVAPVDVVPPWPTRAN